ncbi:MAG: hypothetical protein K8H74_18005 [Notoacmeibacter sp.]|nr:hypothetical protein [Notoacmeibacter sp.]
MSEERDDAMREAAAQVDVIDTAGRVIAHPSRNAVAASAAEVLALAHAVERFWEIAVEGEILARALALPADDVRAHAVEIQAGKINTLMNALRGRNEEESNDD